MPPRPSQTSQGCLCRAVRSSSSGQPQALQHPAGTGQEGTRPGTAPACPPPRHLTLSLASRSRPSALMLGCGGRRERRTGASLGPYSIPGPLRQRIPGPLPAAQPLPRRAALAAPLPAAHPAAARRSRGPELPPADSARRRPPVAVWSSEAERRPSLLAAAKRKGEEAQGEGGRAATYARALGKPIDRRISSDEPCLMVPARCCRFRRGMTLLYSSSLAAMACGAGCPRWAITQPSPPAQGHALPQRPAPRRGPRPGPASRSAPRPAQPLGPRRRHTCAPHAAPRRHRSGEEQPPAPVLGAASGRAGAAPAPLRPPEGLRRPPAAGAALGLSRGAKRGTGAARSEGWGCAE